MYALGIDLGTTYTAAGTWRDSRVEIASLGSRGAVIPSVVLLRDDEAFLTGETANRRALTEPDRVAREFKRRLGDPTPLLLGGVPYAAEGLMARLLRWVVDEVSAREGEQPESICVSHPANWGPYKLDLLQQAVRRANLDQPVSYTSEPAAAATFYAQGRQVPSGSVVAVYDLGGGTFDAAVLRKTDDGFELLGQPEGIERLGGIDFDAAVYNHVSRAIGDKLGELDDTDTSAVAAVARLREECVEAKEALSTDTDVSIPVLLPNLSTEVRLTRSEFEGMVRPVLHESIEALRRALRSAEVEPEDLHAVLLVGGSSRMPLVSQLVGAEIGRPVAVDAHPKHAIALGAAWVASGVAPAAVEATAEPGSAGKAALDDAPNGDLTTDSPDPGTPGWSGAAAGAAAGAVAEAAAGTADVEPEATADGTATDVPGVEQPKSASAGSAAMAGQYDEPPTERTMMMSSVNPDDAGTGGEPVAAGGKGAEPATVSTAGAAPAAAGGTDHAAGPPSMPAEGSAAAPAGGGRSGGRGSQTPLVVAGTVLAAAVISLVGWFIFDTDDGDNVEPQAGEQNEGGEQQQNDGQQQDDGEQAQQPVDEQCSDEVRANDRWVCITSASIADGELVIDYEAAWAGDTPDLAAGFHVHFYAADETGTNPPDTTMGNHAPQGERGDWYIEDQNPSVHPVGSNQANVIGDAPKVCARIANGSHELVPDVNGGYNTGNCWPLTRS